MKNQNQQQATPRPWIATVLEYASSDVISITTEDYAVDFRAAKQTGEKICELPATKAGRAYSEQIIKEHNEHAALVAVAEAAKRMLSAHDFDGAKETAANNLDDSLAALAAIRAQQ